VSSLSAIENGSENMLVGCFCAAFQPGTWAGWSGWKMGIGIDQPGIPLASCRAQEKFKIPFDNLANPWKITTGRVVNKNDG
jgi:hypothetical protein